MPMAEPMDPRVEAAPVFWWWESNRGAQVVVLTDEFLILSSALTDQQLGDLEQERQAGNLLRADFGADVATVSLAQVRGVRFVPSAYQVPVDVTDDERPLVIDPPKASAGVASGLFDVLNKLLAPRSHQLRRAIAVPRPSRLRVT